MDIYSHFIFRRPTHQNTLLQKKRRHNQLYMPIAHDQVGNLKLWESDQGMGYGDIEQTVDRGSVAR